MQGQLPGDLVARLVETGECPAGINVFELRVDVPPIPVLHLEDTLLIFAADLAQVDNAKRRWAGTNGMIEGEADMVLRLSDDLGRELLASDAEGRILDCQLLRIQP